MGSDRPSSRMKFVIALAQIDSIPGDIPKNVRKHVEFIRRARDGGADLVVFPELSLTGYTIRDANWDSALRPDDKLLDEIVRESRECSVILGGVEESGEFGIRNSALFFEKGRGEPVHRKIYLPTYGMFEESRYFSPGSGVRAFDSLLGRIGVLICEDLWHLPLPYILARDGAGIIIGIAASPTRVSGEGTGLHIADVNSEQHRSYARLLSTYIVFCNRVGFEDGVNFWGGSEVVGPDGDVIVRAKLFEEDMVFAEIDENEIRRARRFSRHFVDDSPSLVISELERVVRKEKG